MNIPNWKEFKKNNIIQKETRVKIISMHDAVLNHIENEINNLLLSEQADEVVITKEPGSAEYWPYIFIQYTRYQQYELTDDGYKATGIFHNKDMYEAYRVKDLLVTNMDVL